jgi:hypothetical protein
MAKKRKLVYVRWRDAVHDSGWIEDSETETLDNDHCQSVGFVVRATKTTLKLAMTTGTSDDTVAHTIQIPAGMVLSIEELHPTTRVAHRAAIKKVESE